MRIKSKKLIFAILVAASFIWMPFISAYAATTPDPDKDANIRLTLISSDEAKKPAAGAEVTLYKFADLEVSGAAYDFKLASGYESLTVDPNGAFDKKKAQRVADFVSANSMSGDTYTSDDAGTINATGLKGGVYLAVETKTPDRFTTFDPFVITLPYFSSGSFVYDTEAEPKFTYSPPVDISVTKKWNDDGSSRPSSVKVTLSNEDGDFDTVELNKENNWKHTWTGMDPDKTWSVKEVNVPSGYTVTYANSGFDFTVTNTAKLVQTGQLNWPIPVLLFIGLFLISAGIIVRIHAKRSGQE